MELNQFLLWSLLYLAAVVISAPIAKRLGLGSVLGFLAAGVIIGPSVLGFVRAGDEAVKNFAEFGITMMLFLAGLELEIDKLKELRTKMMGLGVAQLLGVAGVLGLAAFAFRGDWREAVCIGLILALSSTAIVLQSLQETGKLKTPAGQSVFAILLFQDISLIPILALLPLIAGTRPEPDEHSLNLFAHTPVYLHVGAIILAVAAVLVAGRYILRPLFRIIAGTGQREIFVGFSLLLVMAISLLMACVGLSPSLGAFLAGVVLADSEYRHEIDMDLQPFKGLLLAIFFIAVGAEIDFSLFKTAAVTVIASLVGFIALKFATQYVIARIFKLTKPDQWFFTAALTQASEFGFVLIAFCVGLGLLTAETAAMLTAVVALSMAAAPLLMMLDRKVIQPSFTRALDAREADEIIHDGADAIIAGHGRFGMTVGRVLNAQGYKTVVLENDSSQVDVMRKFGFNVFYGDALRLDLLEAAGARHARLLVIAIDQPDKVNELVQIVRGNFPNLEIFVRAFDRSHAMELMKNGVTNVYREVFGSSLFMSHDILLALGHTKPEAGRMVKLFRELDEKFLRKSAAVQDDDEQKLIDLARQSRSEIARVFAADQELQKQEEQRSIRHET
ncbi:monovalent cation:proton antiporter-2 (CPA2) family protein [Aestuariivirga litoralis]|uniref:monovalent cation:proton antiporter-2 (CPA2) family protein n=1 Tax=Aestuariivirga litoralis TaxID=2650924 RepID=UPI0018C4B049|nr:monovalent cation:proton antiporter-2 (CPA2) family protein [Aestuariivirga litoralis]MBG1230931.1 potassium transporter [Aestuariivirga litoralis]